MITELPYLAPDKKVLCVLSGGLDSTILIHWLVQEYGNDSVIALTFNYGQKHQRELSCARKTAEQLNVKYIELDLSLITGTLGNVCSLMENSNILVPKIQDILGLPQPNTYVPYRNMMFCSIALGIAESMNASYVFLGIQAHDLYQYHDCSPEFVKRINGVSELNREHNIHVVTPFIDAPKEEEIQLAIDRNIPLDNTHTCYRGDYPACGTCPSCSERIGNFIRAGVKDPIPYAIAIPWKRADPELITIATLDPEQEANERVAADLETLEEWGDELS